MLQLDKVALVALSASSTQVEGIDHSHRNGQSSRTSKTNSGKKRRRVWLLYVQFKAKQRAQLRWDTAPEYFSVPRLSNWPKQSAWTYANKDTFHRAIKSIIFFSQLFGILPVSNIRTEDPKELKFRIESFPMIFTGIILLSGGFKALQHTGSLLASGVNTRNIVGIVFFYTNLFTCIRCIFLAKSWPQLVRQWTQVELIFLAPPYEPTSTWSLRFKLQILACSFGSVALLEHCMYYASSYYNFRMVTVLCQANGTEHVSFSDFIKQQYKEMFHYVPHNIFWSSYAIFINSSFTFTWNFLDIFIMLISLSLALRFQQFAKRMQQYEGQFLTEALWFEMRQHHIQLCELMSSIDKNVSDMVLVSSLNNMYFICNQLLNIFTKLRWPINYAYFWLSLLYLIARTASVFLFAGQIHDASLLPLRSLYWVPAGGWSEEAQRFYAQIKNEEIGLTGKRFFYVTRKSCFGLAATIVTYEFMLLQFNAKSWKEGLPPLCQ